MNYEKVYSVICHLVNNLVFYYCYNVNPFPRPQPNFSGRLGQCAPHVGCVLLIKGFTTVEQLVISFYNFLILYVAAQSKFQ